MKSNKRFKGFTMMELIVVMAILAVLCGVLVPNGLAWIRDAKIKTCNSQAKVVFNTAVTVLQDYQLEGRVSEIKTDYSKTSDNFNLEIQKNDGFNADSKITSKLGSNFSENCVWALNVEIQNASDKNSNTINVECALFADNNASVYIGRYPVPSNQKSTGGGYAVVKSSILTLPTDTDGDGKIDNSDAIYDHTKY